MRNLMIAAVFIFLGSPAERQDILDPKLPVTVSVKPFLQQSELAILLSEKLQEKKISVVSYEKALAIVTSAFEEGSQRRADQVSKRINQKIY